MLSENPIDLSVLVNRELFIFLGVFPPYRTSCQRTPNPWSKFSF